MAKDQIVNSIERFSCDRDLIRDSACLDPRRFHELLQNGIPENSLERVENLAGVNSERLWSQQESFVRTFDGLSKTLQEEYSLNPDGEIFDLEELVQMETTDEAKVTSSGPEVCTKIKLCRYMC